MASNEPVLVKTPYAKINYTQQQIDEFVACADPVTGPQYFLTKFFYIQHPTQGRLQYHPYDYQKRLIDVYHNYRFSISMMPRQTGKCLLGNTGINIRNNKTGKEYELPINVYYQFMQAQRDGTSGPDISAFEVKNM